VQVWRIATYQGIVYNWLILDSFVPLNNCLRWTIFCHLKMLTIFEKNTTFKHWIKFNVEFFNNIDMELSFNVHFLPIKTLNRNQCQCRCRLLARSWETVLKTLFSSSKWLNATNRFYYLDVAYKRPKIAAEFT